MGSVIAAVQKRALQHAEWIATSALHSQVGRLKLDAPVYATYPVMKMGEMAMYDQYLAHHEASDFDTYDLDDVDAAFSQITPLKYQQTLSLTGAGPPLAASFSSTACLDPGAGPPPTAARTSSACLCWR